MAGILSVFLKVMDKIRDEMDKGYEYEEAKTVAYNLYEEELSKYLAKGKKRKVSRRLLELEIKDKNL